MRAQPVLNAFGILSLAALLATGAASAGIAGSKGHCPPGLAKKGSCIPPGQQKKWVKGDRIPDDVDYRVIVRYDDRRLPKPRPGEVYIETGRDIYLIAEATKRVIEAVNLIEKATN
jgi:Ni/Co efflux regulator RcnB